MTSAKEETHFKNKKVVKLSNGSGVQQDVKLDEAVGHVSQEVIGDLFKNSFTIMVSVELIKDTWLSKCRKENGNRMSLYAGKICIAVIFQTWQTEKEGIS